MTYTVNDPVAVTIQILFENDKGKMVHIRGSPYKASFSSKSPASANQMTGQSMQKFIAAQLEEMGAFFQETAKGASTKDKNIADDVR